MSSDYRYLVIEQNQDGSFSKVTDFTSLDNLIVVKISYQNDCKELNDSEEKQICFKFDDKHYIIDWNMDMNITINEVQSKMLDIKFLLDYKFVKETQNTITIQNPEEVDDPELKRLIEGTDVDEIQNA
jgi:hypothetical protein